MKKNMPAIQIMVLTVFISILIHAPGPAASMDSPPEAEDIIKKYIEATGGEKAYEKIYNRKIETTMTFSRDGTKCKITTCQEKPNKYYSKVEAMTPSGVIRVSQAGADGRFVWTLPRGTVGTVHEGEERENILINSAISQIFSWKTHFKSVKTIGLEDIDGKTCYKVMMIQYLGDERIYYFEKESGLLKKTVVSPPKLDPIVEKSVISYVKEIKPDEEPLTQKDKQENYLSDYRMVDGILMAHQIRQVSNNYEIFTMVIDRIENNIEMIEEQFDLPGKIQRRLQKKGLIK